MTTPAVHAVDLEQFRKAVRFWKAFAELGEIVEFVPLPFRKSEGDYRARVAEADRLLALIDQQAGKGCT